jgi:hypothetical protein
MPVLYLHPQIDPSTTQRVVIDKPGLYPLKGDSSGTRREAHWPHGVWLALLVCHLGDFVTRRASGTETQARHVVRLSGRPLLGDLERLSGEVEVDLSGAGPADPSSRYCVQYRQLDGPPVEFRMPDVSTLRCRYSTRPLGGRRAVRCSGCYRLFSDRAWRSELGRTCPACGWSAREEDEVDCESPF